MSAGRNKPKGEDLIWVKRRLATRSARARSAAGAEAARWPGRYSALSGRGIRSLRRVPAGVPGPLGGTEREACVRRWYPLFVVLLVTPWAAGGRYPCGSRWKSCASGLRLDVILLCFRLLLVFVHAIEIVAVLAFARTTGLHLVPFVGGHFHPLGFNFSLVLMVPIKLPQTSMLAFILRAILCDQSLRHMAIGADRAHAGTVAVVDRLLVFLVDGVAHLVTGDAELLCAGCFQPGMQSTPEQGCR